MSPKVCCDKVVLFFLGFLAFDANFCLRVSSAKVTLGVLLIWWSFSQVVITTTIFVSFVLLTQTLSAFFGKTLVVKI